MDAGVDVEVHITGPALYTDHAGGEGGLRTRTDPRRGASDPHHILAPDLSTSLGGAGGDPNSSDSDRLHLRLPGEHDDAPPGDDIRALMVSDGPRKRRVPKSDPGEPVHSGTPPAGRDLGSEFYLLLVEYWGRMRGALPAARTCTPRRDGGPAKRLRGSFRDPTGAEKYPGLGSGLTDLRRDQGRLRFRRLSATLRKWDGRRRRGWDCSRW